MIDTGFSPDRAVPHDVALHRVSNELRLRGFPNENLPAVGHRPDLKLAIGDYVDVKTGAPERRIAIEVDSLHEYLRLEYVEGCRVYIVFVAADTGPNGWEVDTAASALARVVGGPRRATGKGSKDDWYIVARGGSRFDDFFPVALVDVRAPHAHESAGHQ